MPTIELAAPAAAILKTWRRDVEDETRGSIRFPSPVNGFFLEPYLRKRANATKSESISKPNSKVKARPSPLSPVGYVRWPSSGRRRQVNDRSNGRKLYRIALWAMASCVKFAAAMVASQPRFATKRRGKAQKLMRSPAWHSSRLDGSFRSSESASVHLAANAIRCSP